MPRGIGTVPGHALLNREGGEAEQARCKCGTEAEKKTYQGRRIAWQREHLREVRSAARKVDA